MQIEQDYESIKEENERLRKNNLQIEQDYKSIKDENGQLFNNKCNELAKKPYRPFNEKPMCKKDKQSPKEKKDIIPSEEELFNECNELAKKVKEGTLTNICLPQFLQKKFQFIYLNIVIN